MRHYFAASAVLVLGWSMTGYSQDIYVSRTEVTESHVSHGYLGQEVVGIKPQLGAVFIEDSTGSRTARGAIGLSTELNLIHGISNDWYLGPSTGLIYSHLGAAGSNFFGSDAPPGVLDTNSNLFLIPVNLKIGIMPPSGDMRFSIRGGGNVIYRSVTASTALGQNDLSKGGSSWNIYPNVGADLEIGPLLIRPDWTITPGSDIFTATAGLVIPLG